MDEEAENTLPELRNFSPNPPEKFSEKQDDEQNIPDGRLLHRAPYKTY